MASLITAKQLEHKLSVTTNNVPIPMGTGASDPTSTEIPNGKFTMWKNTSSGEIRMWVNDGGTMKKSAPLA